MFWAGVILTTILGCLDGLVIVSIWFASESIAYQICAFLLCIFITLLLIVSCMSQFNNMIKEDYRMTTNVRRTELYCLLAISLMIVIINIPSSFSASDFIASIKDTKDIWTSAGIVSAITVVGNYFLNPKLLMIQIWGTPTYQKFTRLYLPYNNKKFSLVLHNYSSKKYRITFLGVFKKKDAKKILQKKDWYNLHYPNINLIRNPSKLRILDKDCDSKPITINTQKMWRYFKSKSKSTAFYCNGILVKRRNYYLDLLLNRGIEAFKEKHKSMCDCLFSNYTYKTFEKRESIKKRKSIDLCAVYYVENNKTGNNLIMKHFTIEK